MAYRRRATDEIPDIIAQQEARWMDDGVSEGSMDSLDRRILGIPPSHDAPRQPILSSQRRQRDIAPTRRPLSHPTRPTGKASGRFAAVEPRQPRTLQEKLDEMIAQRNAMYEKHVQHDRPASVTEILPPPAPIEAVYQYHERQTIEEPLRQREARVHEEVYAMAEPEPGIRREKDTRILSRMLLKRPKPLSSAASDLASILGEELEEYKAEAAPQQRFDEYYLEENDVVETPMAEEEKPSRREMEPVGERLSKRALEKRPERTTDRETEVVQERRRERAYERRLKKEEARVVGIEDESPRERAREERDRESVPTTQATDHAVTPEKKRVEEKKKFVKEYTAPVKIEEPKTNIEDSMMDKTLEQFAASEESNSEPKEAAKPESKEPTNSEESRLGIEDSMFDKTLEQFASTKDLAREPVASEATKIKKATPAITSRSSGSKHVPIDDEYEVSIKLKVPTWAQLPTFLNNKTGGALATIMRTLLALLTTFMAWYLLESLAHYFIGKPSYATSHQHYNPDGPVFGEAIPFLLQEYLGTPAAWVARLPQNLVVEWPRQVRESLYEWAIRVSFSDMEREAMRLGVPIAALYRSESATMGEEWSMSMDEVL